MQVRPKVCTRGEEVRLCVSFALNTSAYMSDVIVFCLDNIILTHICVCERASGCAHVCLWPEHPLSAPL